MRVGIVITTNHKRTSAIKTQQSQTTPTEENNSHE